MKKKEKESLRKIVIIGLVLVVGYLGYQSMTSGSSPFSEASEFGMGETPPEDDRAQRQADRAQRQAEEEQKVVEKAEESKQDSHPPLNSPGVVVVPLDQSDLKFNPLNVMNYYEHNQEHFKTHEASDTYGPFNNLPIITNEDGISEFNIDTIQDMFLALNSRDIRGVEGWPEDSMRRRGITGFFDCDQGITAEIGSYCGCVVFCTQLKESDPLEDSYFVNSYWFYEPSDEDNNWGNERVCLEHQSRGMIVSDSLPRNTFCRANSFYKKNEEE